MKYFTLTLTLLLGGLAANAQSAPGASPYVFPEFTKASVLQKNGGTTDGLLNYNTITQEMLFMQGDQRVVLEMESVDTIFIDKKKFIPGTGNIYYQKLTETKVPLYVQLFNKALLHGRNPNLEDQKNNVMSAGQGFRSKREIFSKYDLRFGEGYTMEPQNIYWLQSGKNFIKLENTKSLIKAFPDKEQAINAFLKERSIDLKNTEDLIFLINFCNK